MMVENEVQIILNDVTSFLSPVNRCGMDDGAGNSPVTNCGGGGDGGRDIDGFKSAVFCVELKLRF